MISIEVFSEEKAWSKKLRKKELFFKEICNFFPKKYRFPNKKITLSLLLSNNKCIKKLNKNFRNKNKPTDILSFPLAKKTSIIKSTLTSFLLNWKFLYCTVQYYNSRGCFQTQYLILQKIAILAKKIRST